jgi:hypothetical protein
MQKFLDRNAAKKAHKSTGAKTETETGEKNS